MVRFAPEFLDNCRRGGIRQMLGEHCQQGATDERQIGQEIWAAAAGTIFSENDVAPPVVSNLHACPVAANESEPLSRAVLLGQRARQVIVRLGGALVGFFDAPGIAQYDQSACKGKVRLHGFDGESVQVAGFDSSVSGFGEGKKGVSWSASNRCACLNRCFWLAL